MSSVIAPKPVVPVGWGTTERLEDVLSDLMGGIVIDPHRQSEPCFLGDQARHQHWDAPADGVSNHSMEDTL